MKSNKVLLLIAAAALLLIGLSLQDGDQAISTDSAPAGVAAEAANEEDGGDSTVDSSTASASDAGASTAVPVFEQVSDLPLITEDQLPLEAIETLLLIDDGGPYPFDRDDLVFQNREGLLPARDLGHYREYTVITPGENHRGARRVVAGADGERYYTQDHYESFLEIAWNY